MKQSSSFQFGLPFTPAVKVLVILHVAVWFLGQVIVEGLLKYKWSGAFALVPARVLFEYALWQPLTYMFLHSMNITHILFNMLMLWLFGAEVEQKLGTKRFVRFYLVNGVGAALIYCFGLALYSAFTGAQSGLFIPVVGASGALFGIMLAYGWFFGERVIYFMMLFPMKAKVFVALMGFVQLASMMTSSVAGSEVAYLAHLGGLVIGFVQLWLWKKLGSRQILAASRKKKTRNLRLIVNNEEKKEDPKDPRYWN